MRNQFNEQLALLNTELIKMGALCENVLTLVSSALTEDSAGIAAEAAPIDQEIDEKERRIENICLKLLLKQQPVAGDLRQISAALKMVTDMERIGDQAVDIAELIPYISGRTREEHTQIRKMADAAIKMVKDSVDAYVKQDVGLAEAVAAADDVVDEHFRQVKESLIGLIAGNPTEGEYALDLLMIAKYFERVGDHATNIAEWVLFSITGKKREM